MDLSIIEETLDKATAIKERAKNLQQKYEELKQESLNISKDFQTIFRQRTGWSKTADKPPKMGDFVATIDVNNNSEIEFNILYYTGNPKELMSLWTKLPTLPVKTDE